MIIDPQWLLERLSAVLRWQLTHPGAADAPDAPEVPIAGQRVWGLFLALHAARTGNGFGPNPLSIAEIESYARMASEPIRSFEFEMLRALNGVYLETSREQSKPAAPDPVEQKPVSTKAIFDVLRRAAK